MHKLTKYSYNIVYKSKISRTNPSAQHPCHVLAIYLLQLANSFQKCLYKHLKGQNLYLATLSQFLNLLQIYTQNYSLW